MLTSLPLSFFIFTSTVPCFGSTLVMVAFLPSFFRRSCSSFCLPLLVSSPSAPPARIATARNEPNTVRSMENLLFAAENYSQPRATCPGASATRMGRPRRGARAAARRVSPHSSNPPATTPAAPSSHGAA